MPQGMAYNELEFRLTPEGDVRHSMDTEMR